ncbi:hypothetical protein CIL05_07150 [Virgibacillus profundi]|uniref:Uncharacterized protein n=1 Tax=Virgibacillus profundi TaxID=2024555 RepID=A0A2A2IF11_9BACI|nr:hypothetical protein [Virgibacillus profundi]PAV30237.1 hypothetical protein CIL05_07150 [Virgibacillus profundi]PXY54409.1 hypothetical protein CIT14_07235 [Virgibacillus profundi]
MKKKVVGLLMVGLLLGGTVTYAATNYYADLILNQEDQMMNEISEYYNQNFKERGELQHRDMVHYATMERESLMDRMKSKIDEKVASDADNRRKEHVKHIDNAVTGLEEELLNYINELE